MMMKSYIHRFLHIDVDEALSIITSYPTIPCMYGSPMKESVRDESIRFSLSYLMSTNVFEVRQYPLSLDVLKEKMHLFNWFTFDPNALATYHDGLYFLHENRQGCIAFLGCFNLSLHHFSFLCANGFA